MSVKCFVLTLLVSTPPYLALTLGSWMVSRLVPVTVITVLPLCTHTDKRVTDQYQTINDHWGGSGRRAGVFTWGWSSLARCLWWSGPRCICIWSLSSSPQPCQSSDGQGRDRSPTERRELCRLFLDWSAWLESRRGKCHTPKSCADIFISSD